MHAVIPALHYYYSFATTPNHFGMEGVAIKTSKICLDQKLNSLVPFLKVKGDWRATGQLSISDKLRRLFRFE